MLAQLWELFYIREVGFGMIDYKKLGFKCGLEIHVQLDVGKLFCECPSELRNDPPDFTVRRRLTPVAGEMGSVDVAAKLEKIKNKSFVYEGYNNNDCLVEVDEEPPHKINEKALKVAVQTALMLNMSILDRVFVMRKTVVDGSNTTGFQRTTLVGEDGFVETSEGKVRVNMLSLEEDAARKISETEKTVTYRLDRLGIPLIELRSEPDIVSAGHCKETAEKIGLTTRMTKMVARGIGTIRQDVNVSIRGGSRTEIKGVQDLRLMPKIIDGEIRRQIHLLEIAKELKERKIGIDDLKLKKVDLSPLFKKSGNKMFNGKTIFGARLKGFSNLLDLEIQEGKRLGTEFSFYAKLYGSVGGIIHSDEDFSKYDVSKDEVAKKLRTRRSDAFVLVVADEVSARSALEAVFERARQCLKGVPPEVRNANPDGSTSFLRPIPGGARMYPETDLEPIEVSKDFVESVKKDLPKKPEERITHLNKQGLSEDLAKQIIKSKELGLFEKLSDEFKDTRLIASSVLLGKGRVGIDDYRLVLMARESGAISREAVSDIISKALLGEKIKDLLKSSGSVSEKEIDSKIKKIVKKNKGKSFGAIMGDVMKEFRGRVDGKILSEKVRKEIGE